MFTHSGCEPAGREDVNAMPSLVESYFEMLEAPHKEMIWLEGGHGLGTRTWRSSMK